ncbi:hypothetical protein JCM14076_17690 [Methylosoma difficile]
MIKKAFSVKFLPFFMLVISLNACAIVQPWERGDLAKPHMALDPYPLQSAFQAHNYGSREAGSSSSAAQGGGCGCY